MEPQKPLVVSAEPAKPAPKPPRQRRRLWMGLAAAVLLVGGGFAAWRLLNRPSSGQGVAVNDIVGTIMDPLGLDEDTTGAGAPPAESGEKPATEPDSPKPSTPDQPEPETEPEPDVAVPSSWTVYHNEPAGYNVSYPSNWQPGNTTTLSGDGVTVKNAELEPPDRSKTGNFGFSAGTITTSATTVTQLHDRLVAAGREVAEDSGLTYEGASRQDVDINGDTWSLTTVTAKHAATGGTYQGVTIYRFFGAKVLNVRMANEAVPANLSKARDYLYPMAASMEKL